MGGSNNLEMRLRTGIEADRRYQAENSAKLKAVQTAATYEDFRQMVMGQQFRGVAHMLNWKHNILKFQIYTRDVCYSLPETYVGSIKYLISATLDFYVDISGGFCIIT